MLQFQELEKSYQDIDWQYLGIGNVSVIMLSILKVCKYKLPSYPVHLTRIGSFVSIL